MQLNNTLCETKSFSHQKANKYSGVKKTPGNYIYAPAFCAGINGCPDLRINTNMGKYGLPYGRLEFHGP